MIRELLKKLRPAEALPPPEPEPPIPAVPQPDPDIITPTIEGMTIRLHNGARLKYGESAWTTPDHAARLRELGVAR